MPLRGDGLGREPHSQLDAYPRPEKPSTELSALLIATSVAIDAPRWLAPVLGAAIAFVEGVRTLFGVQDRYLGYRSAAEELRTEAWLFAQRSGPYRDVEAPELLLAERVAAVGTRETSSWAASLRGGQATTT